MISLVQLNEARLVEWVEIHLDDSIVLLGAQILADLKIYSPSLVETQEDDDLNLIFETYLVLHQKQENKKKIQSKKNQISI